MRLPARLRFAQSAVAGAGLFLFTGCFIQLDVGACILRFCTVSELGNSAKCSACHQEAMGRAARLMPLPTPSIIIASFNGATLPTPTASDKLCAAAAAQSSSVWIEVRLHSYDAHSSTRDPTVAGGDAFIIHLPTHRRSVHHFRPPVCAPFKLWMLHSFNIAVDCNAVDCLIAVECCSYCCTIVHSPVRHICPQVSMQLARSGASYMDNACEPNATGE